MRISTIFSPTKETSSRCNSAPVDDVVDPFITLGSHSKLISQVPRFIAKSQVSINIDGTYPTFAIRVMVRLTMAVSCVTDPTVGLSITRGVGIIDLFTESPASLAQFRSYLRHLPNPAHPRSKTKIHHLALAWVLANRNSRLETTISKVAEQ